MNRPLLVALTGGIGAGKSTALSHWSRLGAETIALDEISRDVTRRGQAGFRRVVRAFGPAVLGGRGELDRGALGRRVFESAAARKRLERALHPLILREMERRLKAAKRGVAVVDVPLLFEAGLARRFDVSVLVSAPRAARARRLARRGLSGAEARARMAAQMPEAKKRALADVVIDNNGGKNDFRKKLGAYYRAFELIASAKKER